VTRWVAGLAGAGLLAFAVVAATRPGQAARALDALALWLGALAAGFLAVRVGRLAPPAPPSAIETALRARVAGAKRPPALARLERRVDLGMAHAVDLHTSLAPLLRSIAEPLGAWRGREVELPTSIRAGAPFPHREAPGIAPDELDALLTELERLSA
jgi:hypothetical protein